MMTDDMALVQEYAQTNSERAFGALVSRHVNLVYSVALRQVRDRHLAEEITQSVFIILSRKAKSLSPKTILSGWLCRAARYISADTLKTQRRRQSREQESQMQSISSEPDSAAWNQIAPMLDEALNCLAEAEHDAVVLRFFDGKQLKQVGAEMGTTEDAARMRVNRGLEKLRKFFMKRGVTLSATAITGAVAANSVQAAPAGLAAAITSAAFSGTAIASAAVVAATKTVTMTTLQKAVIATALVATVGAGVYQGRQAARLRADVEILHQQQVPLLEQIQRLQRERDQATNRLASMSDELQRLSRNDSELLKLRGEIGALRLQADELRNLRQNNQKLLAQLEAQSETNEMSVEDRYIVRQTHAVDAMSTLTAAVHNYATNHSGQFPSNFEQLTSSGILGTNNFAGNLNLQDFDFCKNWPDAPLGGKTILSLRNPIPKPGGGGVGTIVTGVVDEHGFFSTHILNVSP